jgi:hypothetical protein
MKNRNVAWLRCLTALSLILSFIAGSSTVALAATEKKKLTGEIIVLGNAGNSEKPAVTLNGERTLSGHTFFSSGVISTSEAGSATVNLGKLGHINLSPNSTLSLNFTENNISGNLSAGQVKVFANEGISVNIQTVDGVINNDANQTGIYTIDVQSGSTKTSTELGSVSLNNGQTNIPQGGQQQPQSGGGGGRLTAALVFAGIMGAATIWVLLGEDDDEVTSPTR